VVAVTCDLPLPFALPRLIARREVPAEELQRVADADRGTGPTVQLGHAETQRFRLRLLGHDVDRRFGRAADHLCRKLRGRYSVLRIDEALEAIRGVGLELWRSCSANARTYFVQAPDRLTDRNSQVLDGAPRKASALICFRQRLW